MSESESVFNRILASMEDWPTSYKDKLILSYRPVWYPKEKPHMRDMFRPCATARLFYPLMFSGQRKINAVIYISWKYFDIDPLLSYTVWVLCKYVDK